MNLKFMENLKSLSEEDKLLLDNKGISEHQIENQLNLFKGGVKSVDLDRPCLLGDGILSLSEEDKLGAISNYEKNSIDLKVVKFVPASGAATRMFKHLHAFLKGESSELIDAFFKNIESFPFFARLESVLNNNGTSVSSLLSKGNKKELAEYVLFDKGLGLSSTPKALIDFHNYSDEIKKSIEEHFVEAAIYARNDKSQAFLHFTISPDHLNKIDVFVGEVKKKYEEKFDIEYFVEYSFQKTSTDTVTVDLDNKLYKKDGQLFFRPGGHGALLENLNDLDADIVFIKNIDNVCKEEYQTLTYDYKKLLGGILIDIEKNVHEILSGLDENDSLSLAKGHEFCKKYLHIENAEQLDIDQIKHALNRPIRICGMVKNQGEPGGGPFWVKSGNRTSCQIVETAQIDKQNEEQLSILNKATHFNPVDLVCTKKDYNGNKFDLTDFRDMETIFITEKSVNGDVVKALELPGLWNGAMANWITVFVEVPLITFNPVKTVNDLLKQNHR